jgi:hypothetical protein
VVIEDFFNLNYIYMNFRMLANFFKTEKALEEIEVDAVLEAEGEDEGAEEEEQEDTEEEAEQQEESEGTSPQVSVERYNALLAAETELARFGATAADRSGFLAETKQLFAWYNNVKAVGVKGAVADANQERKAKAKVKSSVTKEAEEMQAKRQGK